MINIKHKVSLSIILVILLLLGLVGCNTAVESGGQTVTVSAAKEAAVTTTVSDIGQNSDPDGESPEEVPGKYGWVIKIEQTITAPYLGKLGGQNEIMTENTMRLVATNYCDSPYDGEFTGTAYIKSYADAKKQFNVEDVDFLEFTSYHEAHDFKFTLGKTDYELPMDPTNVDERIKFYSISKFLMPLKGDNPANMYGSVKGYQLTQNNELNFSLDCYMQQSFGSIFLETDMFGEFEGTIEWSQKAPNLSPLATDDKH